MFAHLVWKSRGQGRLNHLLKGRERGRRLSDRSPRLPLHCSPCGCARQVLCTCLLCLISEKCSLSTPPRGWVSSGCEAAIKGGPLTHVFAGSLASFAVPLLTLLRALCRTAPVFGQPTDTWVIMQRGSHTGTRSAENVCIYSANLFPKVREWSLVVATIARLLVLFKRGLFGQWSCAEPLRPAMATWAVV